MNVLSPGIKREMAALEPAENQDIWILVLVLSLLSSVTLDKALLFEPLYFSSVEAYLICII